jgi:glycosyltransferase involved in cell wall biosynthesis
MYHLIRGVAMRHEVICLTFAPTEDTERAMAPLHALCQLHVVRGPSPRSLRQRAWTTITSPLPDMALRNASQAYTAALHALLDAEHVDVVQAESIEMARYLDLVRDWRPENEATRRQADKETRRQGGEGMWKQGDSVAARIRLDGIRPALVLDEFNAEFVLQRRAFLADVRKPRRWHAAAYSLAQWLKLAAYERAVLRRSDAVIAVSDEDCQTLQNLCPMAHIGVVPNGVDTTSFSREALIRERIGALSFHAPALVFSGTLDYRPNVDALTWFAEEVLPRIREVYPSVRLLVIGKRPAPAIQRLAADGAIQLIGPVPDVRPYIAGASVYIVPMRVGGGVRFKLLEALSLEAPIVSTRMGAEGIAGLHHGEHCLLADTPDDFAAATLRLLADEGLGRTLGAAGRALVSAQYDWSAIIPRLEALYAEMRDERLGIGD